MVRANRTSGRMIAGILARLLVAAGLFALSSAAGAGTRVQRIVSAHGIVAWLVESHSVPMITMNLSFRGGASQDPEDKPGVAHFASWMLNEGAGEMKTAELLAVLRKLAVSYSKSASADESSISFTSLTKNRDAAFELLRLMLVSPRFDEDAIARGRQSILADIAASKENPNWILGRQFASDLFPHHYYGHDVQGTAASVSAITRADLEAYRRAAFARDNATISVVGDIDAAELASLLDKLFDGLPAHAQLKPLPRAGSEPPQHSSREMDLTQSKVAFGYILDSEFTRKDMAAIDILNQILNGGLLISRLDTEIRVKRGLVYSISCSINIWQHGVGVIGEFGADPRSVNEALALTQTELKRLGDEGPTDEEIRDAKSSLQDSFLVSLNTNAALAGHLQWLQRYGFNTDRLDTYAGEIEAVTADDLRRIAKQVFNAHPWTVAIIGKPSA